MAPKPQITMRDLVARRKSPAVKAIYEKALRDAYADQQALLKKAKEL